MSPKIDNRRIGIVVTFDADTGDVLHVHEKLVETIDGESSYSTDITADECEETRAYAARTFPRRRVDVIVASPELHQADAPGMRYHVDPMSRKLRVEPQNGPFFDPRFASHNQKKGGDPRD